MGKEPWFKVYANDTIMDADLQKCPLAAQAIVFRTWCICHTEGSAPADPEELAISIRCRLNEVLNYQSYYESFFVKRDNRLYSARMEAEKAKSKRNRENVQRRWNKGLTDSVEQSELPVVLPNELRPSDSDSIDSKKIFLEEKAERIYREYPRRVGRRAAIKAITSAIVRERGDSEKILARTREFAKSLAGNRGEFTPHPATWFNQERYNDDPREWERTDGKRVESGPNDSWMTYDPNKPSVYGGSR